ncbi:hypothetical protein JVU11DRAFT_4235 [Chiua virens]|nr:hypothetical protein JVU11DRAFT_4235 [Chiua virens]
MLLNWQMVTLYHCASGMLRFPINHLHPDQVTVMFSMLRITMFCPIFLENGFHCANEPETYSLYCASVLALLKPWRQLTDLKHPTESFSTAFQIFMSTAPSTVSDFIDNIQYYYECSDMAHEVHESDSLSTEWAVVTLGARERLDEMPTEGDEETPLYAQEEVEITEEDIDNAIEHQFSARKQLYAQIALDIANETGLFDVNDTQMDSKFEAQIHYGKEKDLDQYNDWMTVIKQTGNKNDAENKNIHDVGTVSLGQDTILVSDPETVTLNSGDSSRMQVDDSVSSMLTRKQFITYNIVSNHLQTLSGGGNPPQLRILILDEGGTGKTHLLNAISSCYEQNKLGDKLAKTTTTGIAASNICSSTLHSWAGLPVQRTQSDKWATHPSLTSPTPPGKKQFLSLHEIVFEHNGTRWL